MDTARGSSCSLCPGATTCKWVVMLSSAQPLNHIYVTMSKQAHTCNTCTLRVQGSSILIQDDGTGTDTENKRLRQQKLFVILQPPP